MNNLFGNIEGIIEGIVGPMYSGKTTELFRRIERDELAKKKVIILKPSNDKRFGEDVVAARVGKHSLIKKKANIMPKNCTVEEVERFIELCNEYDTVAIDEIMFFGDFIIDFVQRLREMKKRVIFSGLDMDYTQEPFGNISPLLAIANTVDKLTAVCFKCGRNATYSQRLFKGKPAPYGDLEQTGNFEAYEARCGCCFVHPKHIPPIVSVNKQD